MGKSMRPAYSIEFSIGILLAIFAISYVLSHQIFDVPIHRLHKNTNVYFGMCLVAIAVVVMVMITWEELLFSIKIKEVNGGMVFRNHRTKLLIQLLIYCSIPAIFAYIYFNYDIKPVRFFIWAAICLLAPVIEKIISGINNYNDFLILTDKEIEYKNNEKEGVFNIENIQNITIIKDDRNIIEKIQLLLTNNDNVTIDLDEMELDAYYDFINKYITTHYTLLLK
jgi:hypothetical protein